MNPSPNVDGDIGMVWAESDGRKECSDCPGRAGRGNEGRRGPEAIAGLVITGPKLFGMGPGRGD